MTRSVTKENLREREREGEGRHTRKNQQLPADAQTVLQRLNDLWIGRRNDDERSTTHLLQRFARVLLAAIDILVCSEVGGKLALGIAAGQGNGLVAHLACVLDRQMAKTSQALNGNDVAGGDVHLAHAVEDGHASTEKGCVVGRFDVGWNVDGSFHTDDAVLGV